MSRMRRLLARLVCLFAPMLVLAPADGAAGPPGVVASIKPIHSLAAGVMAGIGVPVLIVDNDALPYDYALRPADNRVLDEADVIVWVGSVLERFMVRPLVPLSRRVTVMSVLEQRNVQVLRFHGGTRAQSEADPHVWLDIGNAKHLVDALVGTLSREDPANRKRYAANGLAVIDRLNRLDDRIRASLGAVRHLPYVVYHDAFRYFERRYDLAPVGAVTQSPVQPPDEVRLLEMRDTIFTLDIRCVFVEPRLDGAMAQGLVDGIDARLAVLDPFGTAIPAGADHYFVMMERIAAAMSGCLRRAG